MPLIEVFALLGLRQGGSTAIDVARLRSACAGESQDASALRAVIGAAIGGVVAAIVAFADPERIVVGGLWGPALLDTIATAARGLPRAPELSAARVVDDPAFAGARRHALTRLHAAIASPSGTLGEPRWGPS